MTSYLHIPTGGLEAAASIWIAETFGFSRDVCESASSDLAGFLRGLSVEPTEEAARRVRHWCERYRAAHDGVPAIQLSCSYWHAPLLLTDIESLAAAPVPVQEDR